jgi:hypothetical protein
VIPLALSGWWVFGWIVAALVVLVAAALLVAIILLGRRVVGQAEAITEALDGTRANTDPLWEVKRTNLAIDRVARGLAAAREAVTR